MKIFFLKVRKDMKKRFFLKEIVLMNFFFKTFLEKIFV